MAGIKAHQYEVVTGSPGEALLLLFMHPLGLTAYRLSTDLGVPPIAISEILRGKRSISAPMAARLGVYFGVDPHFWLALQSAYELQVSGYDGEGQSSGTNGVARCAALADQQFVIRESKSGTSRRYEVILARARVAATTRPVANTASQIKRPNPTKPKAKNDKM